MNEEILNQLKAQTAILMTISHQLDTLSQANAPLSPNYRRHLAEYSHFDWASIGAGPTAHDARGVSEVEWHNHRFTRRFGTGKFGKAIWFSRPIVTDDDNQTYARLITFKDSDAKAMPATLTSKIQTPTPPPAPPQATPTPPQAIKPVEIYQTAPATPTIADAPGFYALVNQLIKAGHKNINPLVGQVVADPVTDWAEKAQALQQMVRA